MRRWAQFLNLRSRAKTARTAGQIASPPGPPSPSRERGNCSASRPPSPSPTRRSHGSRCRSGVDPQREGNRRDLRARAVLREAQDGGLYLDEPSWEALSTLRRRLAVVLLAIVVIFGLGFYFASAKR
jgi:hypothetical protein